MIVIALSQRKKTKGFAANWLDRIKIAQVFSIHELLIDVFYCLCLITLIVCNISLQNEVFKAVCSKASADQQTKSSDSPKPTFSSVSDLEEFFTALHCPNVQSLLILEAGVNQLLELNVSQFLVHKN